MNTLKGDLFTDAPTRISHFDHIDSTMTEARRQIESGVAIHGQLILADEQSRGRGRLDRQWISEKGNFYGTYVFHLNMLPAQAAEMSFVSAIALGEAVKSFIPNPNLVCYKWPNDVLVDRRKIAGVLLEAHKSPSPGYTWIAVGIGLNIQSSPKGTTIQSVALKDFTPGDLVRDEVQRRLSERLYGFYRIWREQGFQPIRRIWLENAANRGKCINVKNGEDSVSGTFVDLDAQGRLVLELESGDQRMILAGDVVFPELRMNK